MSEHKRLDESIKGRMRSIGSGDIPSPEEMAKIRKQIELRTAIEREDRVVARLQSHDFFEEHTADVEFLDEHGRLPDVATDEELEATIAESDAAFIALAERGMLRVSDED